jgi:hypothetical protein
MKRSSTLLHAVLAASFALMACNTLVAPAPTATPAVAAPAPTATVAPPTPTTEVLPSPATEAPPTPVAEPSSTPTAGSVPGVATSFDQLSLVLPAGLANGVSGTLVPKADDTNAAPWDVAPAHIQLKLEGYALPDKFLQPQVYVYPAEEYAQARDSAALSLERLRAVLAGAPVTADTLPFVPFFNAAQVFASNVKIIPFQNGQGVCMLTEYAQYFAPVNNYELIYHFEGLTGDGKYYVIAILPVTAPGLAENAQPDAAVPAGGVPYPDINAANPGWPGYYGKVQQMLEGLQPGAFTPSLDQLDALIGSMSVDTALPPTAKEFQPEAGGFSVVTAAELQEQVFPAVTRGATRPEIHSFSGKLNAVSYSVRYCTLADHYASSGVEPSTIDPEAILGVAGYYFLIDGLPGSPITLGADGNYFRELSFDHQGSRHKARLTLAVDLDDSGWGGNRIYSVSVSAPIDAFNEPEADDFLNSFKVLSTQ